jgi:hypothetical protein
MCSEQVCSFAACMHGCTHAYKQHLHRDTQYTHMRTSKNSCPETHSTHTCVQAKTPAQGHTVHTHTCVQATPPQGHTVHTHAYKQHLPRDTQYAHTHVFKQHLPRDTQYTHMRSRNTCPETHNTHTCVQATPAHGHTVHTHAYKQHLPRDTQYTHARRCTHTYMHIHTDTHTHTRTHTRTHTHGHTQTLQVSDVAVLLHSETAPEGNQIPPTSAIPTPQTQHQQLQQQQKEDGLAFESGGLGASTNSHIPNPSAGEAGPSASSHGTETAAHVSCVHFVC